MGSTATHRQATHGFGLADQARLLASSMHAARTGHPNLFSVAHYDVISPSTSLTVLPRTATVTYRRRAHASSGQ